MSKDGKVIRCQSENHVPIMTVSQEFRISVSAKASGDRLHFPDVQAPGQKVPERHQTFEEGLSGEPTDSHNVVVEQPVVEPKEKIPDDMRVSSEEESTALPLIAKRSKKSNTSKPIGRHSVFTHVLKDPDCEVVKPRGPQTHNFKIHRMFHILTKPYLFSIFFEFPTEREDGMRSSLCFRVRGDRADGLAAGRQHTMEWPGRD